MQRLLKFVIIEIFHYVRKNPLRSSSDYVAAIHYVVVRYVEIHYVAAQK